MERPSCGLRCTYRWTVATWRGFVAFALAALAVLISTTTAAAQSCEEPLCTGDDRFQRAGADSLGAYGVCGSCNWLGHCSHTIERCAPGSTLDAAHGVCVLDSCGGCGRERPLCESEERYRAGGTASEPYGVCEGGGRWWGDYRYHRIVECDEGWTLNLETGMCREDCAPDLVLSQAFLMNQARVRVTSIPARQPYWVCFDVLNQGGQASGPFTVQGGGLGVPSAPTQNHASLDAGASRRGCLYYSSAPSPGRYNLGLMVDSSRRVDESAEGNNTLSVRVDVF